MSLLVSTPYWDAILQSLPQITMMTFIYLEQKKVPIHMSFIEEAICKELCKLKSFYNYA